MPTEGEEIVTQEQFFACIEQEIRKIDLFTKRMVGHYHHHHIYSLHSSPSTLPSHTVEYPIHILPSPLTPHSSYMFLYRASSINRIMHPLSNLLHVRVVPINICRLALTGSRYTRSHGRL